MELTKHTEDIYQQVQQMEELLKVPLNEVTGELVHEFGERLQDIKYICRMMLVLLNPRVSLEVTCEKANTHTQDPHRERGSSSADSEEVG